MRFYLVDRIRHMSLGQSIEAVKCWTLSEEYFSEHFPSFPVVPGVLLTESMAQALGLLLEKSHFAQYGAKHGEVFAILSIIQKAKFKGFVRPGDQSILKGALQSLDPASGSGRVELFVDGEKRAEAELVFRLFPQEAAGEALPELKEHRARYHRMIAGVGDAKV